MYRLLAIVAFLSLAGSASAQQVPRYWGDLKPASTPVGFTVIAARDSSRKLANGEARPIQISLWYPAQKKSAGTPVKFGDYIALTASERTLTAPTPQEQDATFAKLRSMLAEAGTTPEIFNQVLAAPTIAVRDAQSKGKSPLILIAQGNMQTAYHQALLAELLAAEGLAVATVPFPTRIADLPEKASIYDIAKLQADDLRFARDILSRDPRVDVSRIGLVGHSFGGRTLLLMARDPGTRAIVSLDGGLANANGSEWLNGTDVSPSGVRVPVLHFWEDVDTAMVPDMRIFQRMDRADRTIVRIDSLYHLHFTSLGNLAGVFPGFKVGPDSPRVLDKIEGMDRLTIAALMAYVAGDASHFPNGLPRFFKVQRMTLGGGGDD